MDQLSFQVAAAYDGTTVGTDTAKQYYVWQPTGSSFTVHVDLAVVDKLHTEVMRGFGAVRRRGTEVGGILLGRIDVADQQVSVTVEDFQPVACEYAHGPSYMLSGEDLQRFRKALAENDPSTGKNVYTVGFYRSHTRDGLALDTHDIRFFREYFTDPLHVVLLIKPFASRAPQAGFFLQHNGVLNSDISRLEFPFRRRELTGEVDPTDAERPQSISNGGRQKRSHTAVSNVETPLSVPIDHRVEPLVNPQAIPLPNPALTEAPLFTSYEKKPSMWTTRLGWLAMCVMLVIFGMIVGMQYTGAPGVPSTVSSATDPYALNLSVSRTDDNLLVTWDPKSLAVKGGWRGVLTISEGSDSKNVQMEPPKLQNGSVLYRHVAPEVSFRLEVFVKEHQSVVETAAYRMGAEPTAPAQR
jgi:hypothetical protein